MIRLIVAIDRKRGLAKYGKMPWKIPEDEQYFTDQTKTHGGNVLVGHTTYQTFKGPLAGRQNYILTHQNLSITGVDVVHDLAKFLEDFKNKDLWVAGGAKVFEEVMRTGKADRLYITHIDADLACDQFFPEYTNDFQPVQQSEPHKQNGFLFTYARYNKNGKI